MRGNKIRDGSSCGISLATGSKGLIQDNDIFGNAHPNVYVASGADPQVHNLLVPVLILCLFPHVRLCLSEEGGY